jgi:hypothetical protein
MHQAYIKQRLDRADERIAAIEELLKGIYFRLAGNEWDLGTEAIKDELQDFKNAILERDFNRVL